MNMKVRVAGLADVPGLLAIQNEIIRIGGTTAHETPMTPERFIALYLTEPAAICCHLAEDAAGVIGFQVLGFYPGLPEGWADIGTFVAPDRQRTGAGVALFTATVAVARTRGIGVINATIRADNVPGLGYYARRGFVDYAVDADFTLKDGTKVGRVSRRFDLGRNDGV
jgi:GNAT superfamily N-acetyltransferase